MAARLAVGLLRAPWGPFSENVGIWQCLFNHGSCKYRLLPFHHRHASAQNIVCFGGRIS